MEHAYAPDSQREVVSIGCERMTKQQTTGHIRIISVVSVSVFAIATDQLCTVSFV